MTNDTRKPVPPREIRVLLYETRDAQPAATVLIEQRRSPIDPSLGASEMEPIDALLACRALVGAEFDAFAAEVLYSRVRHVTVSDRAELRALACAIADRRDEYGDALDDALTALDALADGVGKERDKAQDWLTVREARATFDEIIASVEGIAARLREARGQG